jgi:DNA-binding NarL/FixJ family response regulator
MSAERDIRVAILDDHQSIVDGYIHRLSQTPDIEVVGTALYAEELESILAGTNPEVLILDVHVPASKDNPNSYPILHAIPRWLQKYPDLAILVISVNRQRTLIKAVLEAGASGYILKDDWKSILELGSIIRLIAQGDMYLSQQVHQRLVKQMTGEPLLTSRQLEVLSLCAAYPNVTTNEIATRLGVFPSTVRNLLSKTYLRLGVRNRTAAVTKAMQMGWIVPPDQKIT